MVQYNYSLVALSIVVATLASFTALDLASRITASRGLAARAWLCGGAFAMGAGIWSMHFIGMLAFNSPIPLGYELTATLLSLLIAIVASGFALYIVSRPALGWETLCIAGAVMGLAIVAMHYVGMAAIVLDPPVTHDAGLVVASVAVAVAASLAALFMAFKLRRSSEAPLWLKAASASIMGLAIAGMHYTAMAAVHIAPNAVCLSGSVTDKFWLAGAVAAATLVILGVTLVLSLMDAHMAARSATMNASLEHAQQSNRAKDEFLAMLGHELRNPLAAITNAVALLHTAESGSATNRIALDILDRQTKHLRRMIDDLFEVGRAIAGKITLVRQPLDLYACATNAVAAMSASGRAAQHTLECRGESVWVDGDATRIEQIIVNLLVNSLTYSPAGTLIMVTVSRDAGTAILKVQDRGAGLAPDELPRVFELFYQSDREGVRREKGGLGIGLTLVRRLVELHGGTIDVASAGPGSGVTITIGLPVLENAAVTAEPADGAAAPRQRKVVIVDDDRDVLETLRLLLLRKGHSVSVAEDGDTGLQRIQEVAPDVAIVDISMPGIDGYGVAEEVRTRQLPVFLIALSAHGQAEDVSRAKSAGFDAHMSKPPDLEKLEALVAAAP